MKMRQIVNGMVGALVIATHAHAVLIYNGPALTPTATQNTTAPAGGLAGSGWQYIGLWGGNFSGVPIAPNYFITAKHFGGSATFSYDSNTYTPIATFDDPASDLRIVQVSETFTSYAPLYTGSGEIGSSAVIFGRGRAAGSLVNAGTPNGWRIDDAPPLSGQLTWAQDTIDFTSGGTIGWNFDPIDGSSSLSEGDSGGGVFINDAGTWKLAGINFSITSPFSLSSDGSNSFSATIFNATGLYAFIDPNGPNPPAPGWYPVTGPGASYATSISAHQSFINSVIPEPTTLALLATLAIAGLRRRR